MIGDVISELRKDKGMTQDELASVLNVARSTLASWEIGVNDPGLNSIRDICDYFDVSADFILERSSEKVNFNLESKENVVAIMQIYSILKKLNK